MRILAKIFLCGTSLYQFSTNKLAVVAQFFTAFSSAFSLSSMFECVGTEIKIKSSIGESQVGDNKTIMTALLFKSIKFSDVFSFIRQKIEVFEVCGDLRLKDTG